MPVDKNGVRADVITDSASTISRMNLGRAYEAYMGAFSRDNKNRIIQYLNTKHKGVITPEAMTYIRGYLRDMYSFINTDMVKFIDSLNEEEIYSHIQEVVTDNLYLYYPTDNEYNITDVITNIENSPYKPLCDKVKYIDNTGVEVETKENVRVGVLYFMMLEKIANSYSAVSSSKVNNFGFLVKGNNVDKNRYPHSQTPVRFNAETENRILTAFTHPETVAEMMDLALNPNSHKAIIKSILESDIPYNHNFNIDRNLIPYGQTKSLQILKHMFNAAGFDISTGSESENEVTS